MKELSIEEKAKRYDEALKVLHKYDGANIMFSQSLKEEMFSELQEESEDERIRKELINYLDNFTNSEDRELVDKFIAWLEKQGEQKPLDKVEPKFKVGDWVVDRNGTVQQILSYKDCIYKHTNGYSSKMFEDEWRMWNVAKDAKDGDVLATNSYIIFIFKYLDEGGTIAFRTSCTKNSGVYFPKIKERLCDQDVYPATKEQSDLLFQRMKEAGYEWDAEKKELRKIENETEIPFGAKDSELQEATYYIPKGFHAEIEGNNVIIKKGEQNTAWSEEDETTKNNISHIIRQYDRISKRENQPCYYVGDCLLWMQNIKERVQPQPKQEWSEEDEKMIGRIRRFVEQDAMSKYAVDVNGEYL